MKYLSTQHSLPCFGKLRNRFVNLNGKSMEQLFSRCTNLKLLTVFFAPNSLALSVVGWSADNAFWHRFHHFQMDHSFLFQTSPTSSFSSAWDRQKLAIVSWISWILLTWIGYHASGKKSSLIVKQIQSEEEPQMQVYRAWHRPISHCTTLERKEKEHFKS